MSALRWAPILGLVVVSLIPGALAHHCIPNDSQDEQQFSTQSTFVSSATPLMIGLLVAVPLAVVGAAAASLRPHPPAGVVAARGQWVCTTTAWVWVPEK